MIVVGIVLYLTIGFFLAFVHCYSMTGEVLEDFLGMMLVWLPLWIIRASYGSVRLLVEAMRGE